jgi:O-acetyl-ADP-ribose deacetylase (regulator of RNase III)
MSFNLYLVDTNPDLCSAWKQLKLPSNIIVMNVPIANLQLDGINVFVSPSNSLGVMRGGIDSVYREMFPTIENDVCTAIAKIGHKNENGQDYLPVCSALLVKISGECTVPHLKKCQNYLICCPTMKSPGLYIGDTMNIYNCYRSIFSLVKKTSLKINNLIIPGMGTGVGGVSVQKCAQNFVSALKNYQIKDQYLNDPYLTIHFD